MNKELILGQIPDDFDPIRHIPISPICFIGKEHIYPEFENLEYVKIAETKILYSNLDKLTNDEALSFVTILAKHYYYQVSEKYSFKFWKALFYPWLEIIIPFLFRKQVLINSLINKYKTDKIKVIISERFDQFEFISIDDFISSGIRNISFNQYISTLFLLKDVPANWEVKINASGAKTNYKCSNHKIISHSKKKTKNFERAFYRSKYIQGFTIFDRFLFHTLFSLKKPIKVNNTNDLKSYKSTIDWNINVEQLLFNLVPKELIEEDQLKPPRKYEPGKVINYSSSVYRKSRVESAFSYHFNEVVITTQHGGHMYGSAKTSESINNSEFNADYFISWGWNEYKGLKYNNIICLPSPLLSKFYNKNKNISNKFIYVGTEMNPFIERFDSFLSENEILIYRKHKLNFIIGFQQNMELSSLLYKPYPERNNTFNDSLYLKKFIPDLQLINCTPKELRQFLLSSQCLILDHPGTTWNIAMVMNLPLILFWKRDWFPFNNNSNYFLDEFEKLGVFHETPASAIQKLVEISKIYPDLKQWWNNIEIQDLRQKWINEFALVDKNWRKLWVKKLWDL